MQKIMVPITNAARRYGYIIWHSDMDDRMNKLLGEESQLHLYFKNKDLGIKNIDWKHRRIFIGKKWTQTLTDDITQYKLTYSKGDNKLKLDAE